MCNWLSYILEVSVWIGRNIATKPPEPSQRAIQCVLSAHIFSENVQCYKEICAVYNLVKIHARGWQARRLHTRKSTFLTRPYLEIYVPYM